MSTPFWTGRRRDILAGYLFIAPQLIGAIVFVFVPLGLVVWYSLHEWNVLADTFNFVGGENYQALAGRPEAAARCWRPPACSRSGWSRST